MARRRRQLAFCVRSALIGLCACGAAESPLPDASGVSTLGAESDSEATGEWTPLPAPPLSGRIQSLVATVGDTIFVIGGWDFLCPPGARCVLPDSVPHADGAAYDATIGQWKAISDAPVGLRAVSVAVVGGDIYALSQCSASPTCPAGRALLRYRSNDDAWDMLPGPHEPGQYRLLAMSDGVVAYRNSHENGTTPDYRFFAAEDQWVPLPDDPLPLVFDRFMVEFDGRLLLFGSHYEEETKLSASYDPESQAWHELPASGAMGYQVWRAGSLLYLNPHFGSSGGGIFDPRKNVWRPLSDPPYHDWAGIIGEDEATYEYASGWVLDTRAGDWLQIEPHPDESEVYDQAIATGPALSLVVFGGQSWSSDEGRLVNDMWRWTPPPAGSR